MSLAWLKHWIKEEAYDSTQAGCGYADICPNDKGPAVEPGRSTGTLSKAGSPDKSCKYKINLQNLVALWVYQHIANR